MRVYLGFLQEAAGRALTCGRRRRYSCAAGSQARQPLPGLATGSLLRARAQRKRTQSAPCHVDLETMGESGADPAGSRALSRAASGRLLSVHD